MDILKRRLGVTISRATATRLIGIGTVASVGCSTSTQGAKRSDPPTVEVIQLEQKADLVEIRDMLAAIRNNVTALKKQGRSLDQTIAAKPTAPYDAKKGQFLITPAAFTGLVYMGV
jgi:hypothetical protein